MNIVLIGFKAVGKSTVGSLLARLQKMEFIDLDMVIEQLYQREHGRKIPFQEIYSRHGENYFRELEFTALESMKERDNCVIAVGGGSLSLLKSRELIRSLGTVVYIKEEKSVLFDRITQLKTSLFSGADAPDRFEKLFKERSPLYEQAADVTVVAHGRSAQQIADEIAAHF